MRRLFNEEQDQEISLLYQGGLSIKGASRLYGCSENAILGCLKRTGVHRPISPTEAEVSEMVKLYAAGAPACQIAKEINRGYATVLRCLRGMGVVVNAGRREPGYVSSKRLLSPEQDEEVVVLFLQGYSALEIAEQYKATSDAVYHSLRRTGTKRKKGRSLRLLSLERERQMLKEYRSGVSMHELANRYGIGEEAVLNRIKNNGDRVRTRSEALRTYAINQGFFSCMDNDSKAYLLGLLMADGSVGSNKPTVNLTLKEIDRAAVEYFRSAISSDLPIATRHLTGRTGKLCRVTEFRVNSQRMKNDLIKLDCVPRKSHHAIYPKIPHHLEPSLICGWFDGDGSISFTRSKDGTRATGACWEIWGTEVAAKGIANAITRHTGITLKVSGRQKKNVVLYRCYLTKVDDVLTVCEWMYRNAPYKIPRKWARYMKLKRDRKFMVRNYS